MATLMGLNAKWLSVKDVAERFQVSTETVSRLIKDRELPAVKFGGQYRIAEDQLLEYIQLNSTAKPIQASGSPLEEGDGQT